MARPTSVHGGSMKCQHAATVLSLLFLSFSTSQACTVFLVGKDASVDGSSMVTHSSDGEFDNDPRLVKIPARTFSAEHPRPIFFSPESYPRYNGLERGNIPEYFPTGLNPDSFKPIGHYSPIDDRDDAEFTTFAYLEESYGIANERGLAIGESTCSGVFGAKPLGVPDGTAMWSINELSQIAMERTETARQAVALMGKLAEYHGGFYGASEFEGTAESLAITDKISGENWLFHILPDPTGTSAIWAAQRIPANAVSVLANMFVIREVDPNDGDNFMMSDNIHSIAIEYGWYDPDKNGLLDFTKVYSDGEYAHKFYSGRRVWGAFRLACPDDTYPDDYVDLQSDPVYPVYCVPSKKISAIDLMSFHRDYYEGTKYDLTAPGNLAGGAFSSPDRWKAGKNEEQVGGAWERAIAMYRTSDSFVVQTDAGAYANAEQSNQITASSDSIVWYGPSAALSTFFTPFLVSMDDVPASYRSGHPYKMDRYSAFWAATAINNLANLKWSYAIHDIREQQQKAESSSMGLVTKLLQGGVNSKEMNAVLASNADDIAALMWQVSDDILFKYASGFVNELPDKIAQTVGYPAWWLEAAGYPDGPPPPPVEPRCCNPSPVNRDTPDNQTHETIEIQQYLRAQ